MILRLFILALVSFLQGACSLDPLYTPSSGTQPSYYPNYPPPAVPPTGTNRAAPSLPAPELPEHTTEQAAIKPTPPAVIALMQQAENDRRRGDLERAASRLERALRIQPGSAELWYELANIRLQQEQPGLAEELAKKSLSLAGGRADLIHRNWRLIAQARYQRGELSGARDAERRVSSPY